MNARWMILILLILPLATADRNLPAEATTNETLNITYTLTGATIGEDAVLGERLPANAILESWTVEGGENAQLIESATDHIWVFTATTENPSVSYSVRLPPQEGVETFDAVHALPPDQIGRKVDDILLRAPTGLVTEEPRQGPQLQLPEQVQIIQDAIKARASWWLMTVSVMFLLAAISLLALKKINSTQGTLSTMSETISYPVRTEQYWLDEPASYQPQEQHESWQQNYEVYSDHHRETHEEYRDPTVLPADPSWQDTPEESRYSPVE